MPDEDGHINNIIDTTNFEPLMQSKLYFSSYLEKKKKVISLSLNKKQKNPFHNLVKTLQNFLHTINIVNTSTNKKEKSKNKKWKKKMRRKWKRYPMKKH